MTSLLIGILPFAVTLTVSGFSFIGLTGTIHLHHRSDINQGIEDIQMGRSITLSSDEEVDQFISQIMGNGR